jgi:hypothetical protein
MSNFNWLSENLHISLDFDSCLNKFNTFTSWPVKKMVANPYSGSWSDDDAV